MLSGQLLGIEWGTLTLVVNGDGVTGSLEITSTAPIVSLALNAEAAPMFSSLPPGKLSIPPESLGGNPDLTVYSIVASSRPTLQLRQSIWVRGECPLETFGASKLNRRGVRVLIRQFPILVPAVASAVPASFNWTSPPEEFVRAPITMSLMSPLSTLANSGPASLPLDEPAPSTPLRRSWVSMTSGMIRCWPDPIPRLKRAVRSGVLSPSATKLKWSVVASSEKVVTVRSRENSPVSTITGKVCPVVSIRELAVSGKTKEP